MPFIALNKFYHADIYLCQTNSRWISHKIWIYVQISWVGYSNAHCFTEQRSLLSELAPSASSISWNFGNHFKPFELPSKSRQADAGCAIICWCCRRRYSTLISEIDSLGNLCLTLSPCLSYSSKIPCLKTLNAKTSVLLFKELWCCDGLTRHLRVYYKGASQLCQADRTGCNILCWLYFALSKVDMV